MEDPDSKPLSSFRDLHLPDALLKATEDLGFDKCTEIQGLTLPIIMAGRDVAAQAQTGTGKTAAFLLGSFARLLEKAPVDPGVDQPRMLIIAPTRELAIQIKNDADALGAHTNLNCAVVYGGIDYDKQRRQLAAGVDILIGTPGRLIDYYKQKVFDLKKLEILVLDEADRMFDLGFIADIRFLLRRMPDPEKRLSMLFSATLSHRVMELAYEHMNNPAAIKTESTAVTAKGVRQILYQPASDEKIPLLLGLIERLEPPRSIVFVNTKRAAERVESYLAGNDIRCGTLSGDVRQNKRQKILADFTAGRLPVLIATDVAARGLHIDDVSHVFNYDLPQQAEDYVHRIGRTARAGTDGIAVSFACETYSFSLPEIQDYIDQAIPLEMITDELLKKPKPPRRIEHDRVKPPVGRKDRTVSSRKTGAKRHAGNRGTRGRNQAESLDSERRIQTGETDTSHSGKKKSAHTDTATDEPRRRRRRRRKPSKAAASGDEIDASQSLQVKDAPTD